MLFPKPVGMLTLCHCIFSFQHICIISFCSALICRWNCLSCRIRLNVSSSMWFECCLRMHIMLILILILKVAIDTTGPRVLNFFLFGALLSHCNFSLYWNIELLRLRIGVQGLYFWQIIWHAAIISSHHAIAKNHGWFCSWIFINQIASCMTSANKRWTTFGRRWWKLVSIFFK